MASSANRNPEPPGSPVTLITGTSRGIGRHLAKHCLARGHVVVGCSRTPADWSAAGYRHVVADVREEGEVLALFRELRRAHGRLDHLVNNAGIASMNHALTTPVSTVRNILDVNVVSTFLFAREAAKLMMRKGFGRIVNLSSVALLVALIHRGAVVVPLTDSVETQKPQFREVAEVEVVIALEGDGEPDFRETGVQVRHPLYLELRGRAHPGLILFSSGSTGKNKASLHDLVPFLEKFKVPRQALRTITFLLFDHIGGLNTLLYTLSNAGCVIAVEDRSPDSVCRAMEGHRAQLLPTFPTFMNLLLLSEAHARCDLSSLELVTYGTEVMPETTLRCFRSLFPQVRLLQTYGLSEVGILRSKSKSSDSLWVKVGGEGFQTRVVDGLLEIKAQSAMMGYLNHESPFTPDGWFMTGDAVEVDGEYIRILGRKSEIINVGGEKVYPAEVESVIQLMDGVEDVAVRGEPNPITGQMVVARVMLSREEDLKAFRSRLWAFCRKRLPRFKIPQKIQLVDDGLHGARFKKMR